MGTMTRTRQLGTILSAIALTAVVWAWNGGSFAPLNLLVVGFVVWLFVFADR